MKAFRKELNAIKFRNGESFGEKLIRKIRIDQFFDPLQVVNPPWFIFSFVWLKYCTISPLFHYKNPLLIAIKCLSRLTIFLLFASRFVFSDRHEMNQKPIVVATPIILSLFALGAFHNTNWKIFSRPHNQTWSIIDWIIALCQLNEIQPKVFHSIWWICKAWKSCAELRDNVAGGANLQQFIV